LANEKIYEKIKEEFKMCQALQELMKDVIDEKVENAVETSVENTTITLIKALMDYSNIDVDEAMTQLQIPESERNGLKQKIDLQLS
jgi:hypothetical protein